jgi:hypothetical protein
MDELKLVFRTVSITDTMIEGEPYVVECYENGNPKVKATGRGATELYAISDALASFLQHPCWGCGGDCTHCASH